MTLDGGARPEDHRQHQEQDDQDGDAGDQDGAQAAEIRQKVASGRDWAAR